MGGRVKGELYYPCVEFQVGSDVNKQQSVFMHIHAKEMYWYTHVHNNKRLYWRRPANVKSYKLYTPSMQ